MLDMLIGAGLCVAGAVALDTIITLREELKLARIQLEEALAWSDKYQLDAYNLKEQLRELRQQHALLQYLHDGTTMLEQSAAWRAGLRIRK